MGQRRQPPSKKPDPDSPRTGTSLRAHALRLLARREHTRAELKARLAAQGADPAEVAELIEEFSRRGWISDTRVLEQIAHARRSRFGSARIRQDLAAKGVPDELIDDAMSELREGDLGAARIVWRKKFSVVPSNAAERARQLRFLQSRGFSLELAIRVLREAAKSED